MNNYSQTTWKRTLLLQIICLIAATGCQSRTDIEESNQQSIPDEQEAYHVKIRRTGNARIVENLYPAEEIIIADYDVVSDYDADPTGVSDSTASFQKALDDCYANGGGTVWVPSGTYTIKNSIIIRPFCTIRGDWQDPDNGTEYGTVIKAEIPEGDVPLFLIGGSAGVIGFTVYYPLQQIENPIPYGWTFEIRGNGDQLGTGFNYHASTIKNVTLLNSYKGIGINAAPYDTSIHELSRVENIKGTALFQGVEAKNCADVGMWRNITFSNRFWSGAPQQFNPQPLADLNSWTRTNGEAITLGDLEWDSFYNIKISNYKTGIRFVNKKRIGFAGQFTFVRIENTDFGVLAEPISIDSRYKEWGVSFNRSHIEGSEMAIRNDSWGYIFLSDSTVNGIIGTEDETTSKTPRTVIDKAEYSLQAYPEIEKEPTISRSALYDTSINPYNAPWSIGSVPDQDSGPAIQQALNDAGREGGGVVYLPAGWYRINSHLTIPANVELRGASAVMNRSQSGLSHGTVLFAFYGAETTTPDNAAACVTLEGNSSGIRGLRIFYPENAFSEPGSFVTFPWAIRIKGADDTYIQNVAIENAYRGLVAESGSDRHYIRNLVGAATHGFILIKDSSEGWIEDCHTNPNFWPRIGYGITPWMEESDSAVFWDSLVPVRREHCYFIKIENTDNENLMNNFGYAVLNGVDIIHSSANIFNIGTDNLGNYTVLAREGSDVKVINSMRWNGEGNTYDVSESVNPRHLR